MKLLAEHDVFVRTRSDVLFRIFRHFSEWSRNEEWLHCICQADLKQLFDIALPFGYALINKIKALSVGGLDEATPGSLCVTLDIVPSVLEMLGGSLEHVRVDCCSDVVENLIALNEQLSRHCVGLKSLSLSGSLETISVMDVIVKRASSLEKLCIRLYTSRSDRPLSFPGIPLPEFRALIIKDLHVQDANELATFLTTSGGKLEHVDIEWRKGSASEWTVITDTQHSRCRNVRRISLNAGCYGRQSKVPRAEERRLLISYGAQLQEAKLILLPTPVCESILQHCPSVQCKWDSVHSGRAADRLEKFALLSPRLNSISFSGNEADWLEPSLQFEHIKASMASATNLKYLHVGNRSGST